MCVLRAFVSSVPSIQPAPKLLRQQQWAADEPWDCWRRRTAVDRAARQLSRPWREWSRAETRSCSRSCSTRAVFHPADRHGVGSPPSPWHAPSHDVPMRRKSYSCVNAKKTNGKQMLEVAWHKVPSESCMECSITLHWWRQTASWLGVQPFLQI